VWRVATSGVCPESKQKRSYTKYGMLTTALYPHVDSANITSKLGSGTHGLVAPEPTDTELYQLARLDQVAVSTLVPFLTTTPACHCTDGGLPEWRFWYAVL
jgi:hypothetical protein